MNIYKMKYEQTSYNRIGYFIEIMIQILIFSIIICTNWKELWSKIFT